MSEIDASGATLRHLGTDHYFSGGGGGWDEKFSSANNFF